MLVLLLSFALIAKCVSFSFPTHPMHVRDVSLTSLHTDVQCILSRTPPPFLSQGLLNNFCLCIFLARCVFATAITGVITLAASSQNLIPKDTEQKRGKEKHPCPCRCSPGLAEIADFEIPSCELMLLGWLSHAFPRAFVSRILAVELPKSPAIRDAI